MRRLDFIAGLMIAFAAVLTVAIILAGIAAHTQFRLKTPAAAADALSTSRTLYAVNQSSAIRGSISVYDIDRGHGLVKTIPTVPDVSDVREAWRSVPRRANFTSPPGTVQASG
jgi:hypothetical protein